MSKEASDALVRWFAESFDVAGGVLYEMFGLTDNFGTIMKQNLMVSWS
jgi:[phosphatase 2A protein]-leucine-carboxy methyltransferase